MSDKSSGGGHEAARTWAKETLDDAVDELMRRGVITAMLFEAKPIWSLPGNIMIGQFRNTNEKDIFTWVISGDVPIDHLDSTVAATPRNAARHFAFKWQLDAARYRDPSVQAALGPDQEQSWDQLGETLAQKAELMFELVDNESLWP